VTDPVIRAVIVCAREPVAAKSNIPATEIIAMMRLKFIWSLRKNHSQLLQNF
jgi:hypothetical protein